MLGCNNEQTWCIWWPTAVILPITLINKSENYLSFLAGQDGEIWAGITSLLQSFRKFPRFVITVWHWLKKLKELE